MNAGDALAITRLKQALPVGLSAYAEAGSINPVAEPQAIAFQPGQRYQGEILRHLQGQQFLVRIHNQLYQANLDQSQSQSNLNAAPGNPGQYQEGDKATGLSGRVGQTYWLEYQGGHPSPVFKLLHALPELAANIKLTLSPAAYQLGQQLQQSPMQAWNFSASAPVLARVPAAMAAEKDAAIRALFVQEIRHAVQNSGLFYESHLAQWVRGNRTLSEVLQEPQNHLHLSQAQLDPEHSPAAVPTLGQQLAVLERQQLHWQGEVWPGQHMHMQLGLVHNKQAEAQLLLGPDRDTDGSEAEQSMQAGVESGMDKAMAQALLALDMPHLGRIKVRLAYVEGSVQINIHAADTASLQHMRSAGHGLADNLKQAGQKLQSLQFNHAIAPE